MLDRWNIAVSEDMRAGDLRVEARQLVEIARALSYGARFIILDEPTAQLDGDEIKRLFVRMPRVAGAGRHLPVHLAPPAGGVRDLSGGDGAAGRAPHRLRRGRTSCPRTRLIEAMTGETGRRRRRRTPRAERGRSGRRAGGARSRASLAGEDYSDVGLSGASRRGSSASPAPPAAAASGSPRRSPASVGYSRRHRSASNGRPLPPGDVPAALALGVGCVPKSRHAQGLVLSQSVGDNATMTIPGRLGALRLSLRRSRKAEATTRGDPRPRHRHRRVRTSLSPASRAATSRRS